MTTSLAIIESPFQLLGLIEAIEVGAVDAGIDVALRAAPSSTGGLLAHASRAGVAFGDVSMLPSSRAVVRRGLSADRLIVGDPFSGVAQTVIVGRRGGSTLLLDDGASSLHAAAALRNEARMSRPCAALGPARLTLGASARTQLQADAEQGHLAMFTAFADIGGEVPHVEVWRNEFEWSRRIELTWHVRSRPRVVLGSALADDGLISESAYHAWLADQIRHGETHFLPHRRESKTVVDLVRRLGAETVANGGWPAELVLRDAPACTEFRTLPSTIALTMSRVRNVTDLRCESIPASWWTPAAPPPMRSLLSRVARAVSSPGAAPDRMRLALVG